MASSALESPWVVTSERSSRGPMSSLKALWTQVGHKKIYSNYERPPFPIIIDKPSVYDLVGSWRFSDYCMFGAIYGTGILWAFTISRPMPSVMQKLLVYHGVSHMAFIVAACDSNQFTPSIQMLVALQVGARMAAFISGTLSQVSSYRPVNSISELGI